MKRRFIRIAGIVFTILAIAFFVVVVLRNVSSLPSITWTWRTYLDTAELILLYAALTMMPGCAWFLWLRGLKEHASLSVALIIYELANIAKYIPGNIAQLVGRTALARQHGLNVPRVMLTLLLEAAWGILSAAVTAVAILLIVGRGHFGASKVPPAWEIGVVAVVAGTAPFIGVWLLKHWRSGLLKKLLGSADLVMPSKRTLLACFLLYTATYIVMGTITVLLAHYLFDMVDVPFWLTTGIVTLAWVAGFVTPGSPGGIGVREAILVATLGPVLGAGVAIGVSVALRVVTTFGDGVAFLVALALKGFVMPVPMRGSRVDGGRA